MSPYQLMGCLQDGIGTHPIEALHFLVTGFFPTRRATHICLDLDSLAVDIDLLNAAHTKPSNDWLL
jgi:hypothetical protein